MGIPKGLLVGSLVLAGAWAQASVSPPRSRPIQIRATIPDPSLGPSETPITTATPRRGRAVLQLLDLTSSSRVVRSLGEFDTTDHYPTGPIPRTQGRARPPVYLWARRPFSRDLAAAADGRRVHVGDGTTFEVRTFDGNGQIDRILEPRPSGLKPRPS